MGKRLGIGALKGLILGAAFGAGIGFGLGWFRTPGLLGYLLAMGVGATTAVLAGKPPWRHSVWLESLLKAVAGVGLAALLYWLATDFGAVAVPFAVAGAEAGTPWIEQPLIYAPLLALLFGTLIELDNTDDDDAAGKKSGGKKTAVDEDALLAADDDFS